MNTVIKTIICTFALISLAGTASAASINERQENQRDRITQGVKSGELTKRETKALVKNQKHIARTERRMKADGTFSLKERARLQHKQNKASKRIFVQKHDRADRN